VASGTSEGRSTRTPSPLRGILGGGLLAGIGDITYAIVVLHFRGRSALWTLQSVASGLLGESAFERGLASGLLGLAAHFTNATGAAAVYWVAARNIAWLRNHPVLSGLVFGPLVFLFMNFVVIPLSAFPFDLKYPLATLVKGFVSHALLVGLPIALAARYLGGLEPDAATLRP
jgi:hypothetical protein